jgi:hypothetical protein
MNEMCKSPAERVEKMDKQAAPASGGINASDE